ncbi:hypothetical protein Dimus_031076, partial [Dionaea muscipula]
MRRRGRPPKQRGVSVVKDGVEMAREGIGADRELDLVEVPVEERVDSVRDECDLTLNLLAPGSAMSSQRDLLGSGSRAGEARPFSEAGREGSRGGGGVSLVSSGAGNKDARRVS